MNAPMKTIERLAMKILSVSFICFLGILESGLLGAEPQEAVDLDEHMVVTAQFTPESARESIYKVRIIDQEKIRATASRDLRDLLEHELQFDLQQNSVFGTSAGLQGLSFENLKILYDGVPVLGRLNGIIDLSHIGLDGIERVEIIEGPASVYYGTDALAGVVNLISRKGTNQGPLSVTLDGQTDSVGSDNREIRGSWFNGSHSLELGIGEHDFDGYSPTDNQRNDIWSEREQVRGNLRYTRHFNQLDLGYEGRFFSEDLTDRGEPNADFAQDTLYTTERYSHKASLNGSVMDQGRMDLLIAYSDYERRKAVWNADLTTGTATQSTQPRDSDFTGFEQWMMRGQFAWENKEGNLGGQLGFETVIETGTGARIQDGEQRIEEYAGFAGVRFTLPGGLEVQPAFRATRNSAYDSPVTPALNLRYGGGPGEFRASYSRGFRSPSLKQLFLDFTMPAGPSIYHITGNPDLKAEQGDSYNLSHVWRVQGSGNRSLRMETTLFYNHIENLIELGLLLPDPANPGHFNRTYLNINDHKTRGGRVSAVYGKGGFSAALGLSLTEQMNALSQTYSTPQYNRTLDGQCNLAYAYKGYRVNTFFKYNGEETGWFLPRNAETPEETRLAAWKQMDVGLSKRLFNQSLELAVGVKNLFDVTDLNRVGDATGAAHEVSHLSWGRSVYANVRYVWKK